MRLSLLLIITCTLSLSATITYSQQAKLSLNLTNASIQDLLQEIGNKSDFSFWYSNNELNANCKITLAMKDQSIDKILDIALKGQNLAYEINDKIIVIYKQKDAITVQQQKVTGTVTDATNAEPVIGANIIIEGTTRGTVTDADGKFSLDIPKPDAVLVVSFLGYNTERIPVGGQNSLEVKLVPDITKLEEVVAIGYGTQKKSTVTGALTSTKGEFIVASSPTNISNALAGRLPGLSAIQGNGEPGAGSNISIRGISTLGDNSVLIVIDGIVRDNAFDYIDPNEIASISVLKDAAATAVYGSRAANGVILLTTKRGSSAKPKFTYSTFMGFQQPTKYPKMMNAYQYATVQNAGYLNAGLPARFTDQEIADFKSGKNPGIDLYALVFKNQAFQSSHNLNVNGGTDAIKYFASVSYLDQKGLYDANNFNRYSIRSNVDAKINSNLTISTDIDANVNQKNDAEWSAESLFYDVAFANPTIPFLNPDGSPNYKSSTTPLMAKTGYRKVGTNVLQASMSVRQELPFIEGMNIEGKAIFAKEFTNAKDFSPPNYSYIGSYEGLRVPYGGYNGITSVSASSSQYLTSQYRLSLNYNHNFGNHHLTGLMLFEQFDAKGDNMKIMP